MSSRPGKPGSQVSKGRRSSDCAISGYFFFLAIFSALLPPHLAGADIPTAQYDSGRTSWNSSEIYLNSSNVNSSLFGKLFTHSLDGWVYAQPLYLQNLAIPGEGTPNVVFVCTANNTVYAFDADNPAISAPYWATNLGAPDTTPSTLTNPNSEPSLGIISTPAIVRSSNTLYVTAATRENGHRVYRLHALDITSGQEKPNSPVVIAGHVSGNASDSQNGILTFDPDFHLQRATLSIAGGSAYVMTAGSRDIPPFHGWIFGYDVSTLAQTTVMNLTANGMGAGIWQSMRAPVVDAAGSLYIETGNGDYDGAVNFGNSVVRLAQGPQGLAVADWFTPDNWQYLSSNDLDLSSAGPLLVPGTDSLIAAGKNGTVYVLNTANMGQLVTGNGQITRTLQAEPACNSSACDFTNDLIFWNNSSSPALYVWPLNDVLRSYSWSDGQLSTSPASINSVDSNYPGGYLAGSSNGSLPGTGIVWAMTGDNENVQAGTLRAFDASNVSSQLWTSDFNEARDSAGSFAKDLPPLVVNGKVYVGNFSSQLIVYGLLNGVGTGPVNLTLGSTTNPSVYSQPLTLTATVSPPGATGTVAFTDGSTSLGTATVVSGSAMLSGVILAAGSHSLSAAYSGDSNYAAGTVSLAQSVSKATPTITWAAPAAITYGIALSPVQLNASADVPSSFVYTPDAGTVLPSGKGQSLSALFTPADTADYTTATASVAINVNSAPEAQTIAFTPLSNVATGTAPFSLTATATSGLTVSFASTTPAVCAVSGNTVTILTGGGCSITATQQGNSTYAAAPPVTQSFTVLFTDVAPTDYYYAAINAMAQLGITAGCGNNGYCPLEQVTRDEMAIFLVRAIYGSDNFTYSTTPVFTDVQPATFGFKWIQKLAALGITAGCGAGLYCPTEVVTRDQMAIFIERARLGLNLAGSPPSFTYSTTPMFTDVPASEFAFPWIQRLAADNITSGCRTGTYCPDSPVIRGDMAIFIMRGAFNQFLPAGTPKITQISPSTLPLGTSGTYTITGANTNFAPGTTQLSPIPGVTIGTITVTSPTSMTVQLTASANAVPQPYSVLAITGTEQDVLPNGLVLQ
jgi:hypothetical protein